MKRQTENSRQVVNRFLVELGEPLSSEDIERATGRVLERLQDGDSHVVSSSFSVSPRVSSLNWVAIAAGVAIMLVGGLIALLKPPVADVVARSSGGELYVAGNVAAFPVSIPIEAGKIVRAGGKGAVFTLLDGSEIEMGPRTELSVITGRDGLRVLLTSGNVIVTAARQRHGHLYVETWDCIVSVVGTVFTVNAEESGSRVSVIEGQVQVQRGDISQTLLPGQQVATSPTLGPVPLKTEIEWSRSAPGLTALVQQSVPPPQTVTTTDSQILRGIVKQSSGEGIPDVTVTLCGAAGSASPPAEYDVAIRNDKFYVRRSGDEQQTAPQYKDPLVKNKTFFFALWNAAVLCGNPRTVTTDSQGRFQFSDVPPGRYAVSAEREGYLSPAAKGSTAEVPQVPPVRYAIGPAAPNAGTVAPGRKDERSVTVEAGKAPPEISMSLVRGGVIAGSVRDSQGRPAVSADVRVVPAMQTAPARGNGEIQTTTNDRGEYRAFWFSPGEYVVVARAAGGVSYSISRDSNYFWAAVPTSGTWFTRGATLAEATPVVVREGEEVLGIDIVLREVQTDSRPNWYRR